MFVRPPEDLVKRITEGRAVLFVGAGMSRPDLPGWQQLLEKMLVRAESKGVIPASQKGDIQDLINRNKLLLVAKVLRKSLGEPDFRRFLDEVFGRPDLQPTESHKLLPSINFSCVLTT